eukprot:TRINITY_DN3327_c0_g2_i9.p1 TRINITY_DN3327_c0_g2~~TRINITY_DN3327_c0_g2_i9.p1  ORF type:complete len:146 (-),score=32.40 TRINITY_DN3327_c0_g2_i9:99-536(-)
MSGDGYITSFNVETYQQIQKVHCGCDSSHFSFAISPDKTQIACGKCAGNVIKIYSIVIDYDPSHEAELIRLSRDGGYVLSNLMALNIDTQLIRQLVAAGIYMNEVEYSMIVDTCWDLSDINEMKGGNMHSFFNEQSDYESDEVDD